MPSCQWLIIKVQIKYQNKKNKYVLVFRYLQMGSPEPVYCTYIHFYNCVLGYVLGVGSSFIGNALVQICVDIGLYLCRRHQRAKSGEWHKTKLEKKLISVQLFIYLYNISLGLSLRRNNKNKLTKKKRRTQMTWTQHFVTCSTSLRRCECNWVCD